MTAVPSVLLEITVYSVILYGAILLFQKAFRKHISAALNYAVWALLVLRLMMPVTVDTGLHLLVIPDEPKQNVQADNANTGVYEQPNHSLPKQPIAQDTPPGTLSNNAVNNPVNDGRKQPAAWKIDWQTALALLWGAGMLGSFVLVADCWRRLRQKIKRYEVAAPGYVLELVDKYKEDMGIQANIQVSVQGWLKSPALSSSLKPKLLLPEHMLHAMDARQLEFGIRHELMHYRRKDHIANLLLTALRCAYWFNPIIYFAFRRVQIDMEAACDASITSRLENPERIRYIRTIIDLSGSNNMKYVLGMGMCKGRKAMEKRVRGIFMKKRTGPSSRLAAAVLAGLMLVMCFTTACQPTPTENIVQSKNNDSVQDAIKNNPQSTGEGFSYTAPKTWKSAIHDDDKSMSIYVDASVDVPSNYWGIYQLIPQKITRQEANAAIRALIGDSEIRSASSNPSAAEIQEQIILIQAEMAKAKAAGNTELYDIYAKEKLPTFQAELAEANATNSGDMKKITPDLLFEDFNNLSEREKLAYGLIMNGTGYVFANWQVDLGKAAPARIQITLNDGVMKVSFVNNDTNDDFPQRGIFSSTEALRGLNISLEDAQTAARQMIEKLGFGYLDIASINTNEIYDPERLENNQYPQCYEFTFNRKLDGVPVAFAYWNGGLWTEEEWEEYNKYAVSWTMREVVVQVDDSGVIGVKINVPKSDVNRLAYGIELMDFEEVMKIFEKQVLIEGCFSTLEDHWDVKDKSVYIDDIRLNYMPTIWKDHPDEIIFVPVWDFYGSQVTVYNDNVKPSNVDPGYLERTHKWVDGQLQRQQDFGEQSILTINAIDGTIMRRNAYMEN